MTTTSGGPTRQRPQDHHRVHHRRPHGHRVHATPPVSDDSTAALNRAELALIREKEGLAPLPGVSEQPLLAMSKPTDAGDAAAYTNRTKGQTNANWGVEADNNLRQTLGLRALTPRGMG